MPNQSSTQWTVSRSTRMAFCATWWLMILVLIGAAFSYTPSFAETPEKELALDILRKDPARVVGVVKGDCKKCHPSEVAAWTRTMHFQSADLRLRNFTGNTKKYAEALGVAEKDLMKNSVCADCHGTKSVVENEVRVISGVSCESCHGASGGENGWLNRHQSYHETKTIPREQETPEHREARIDFCKKAGKVFTSDIKGLARNCYSCHVIDNEKLIAAGHKAASAFDFVSWSEGEVRHNFHLDKTTNAPAPTLWLDDTRSSPENRRRLKFVVGAMSQLEETLRRRADLTNPAVIPQIGGIAAAANGKLAQINGMAGTDQTKAVGNLAMPLLGFLFVPQPTDKKFYTDAADKIAEQIKEFSLKHDGSKLSGLDTIIKLTPPHYSEQFKKKYQTK